MEGGGLRKESHIPKVESTMHLRKHYEIPTRKLFITCDPVTKAGCKQYDPASVKSHSYVPFIFCWSRGPEAVNPMLFKKHTHTHKCVLCIGLGTRKKGEGRPAHEHTLLASQESISGLCYYYKAFQRDKTRTSAAAHILEAMYLRSWCAFTTKMWYHRHSGSIQPHCSQQASGHPCGSLLLFLLQLRWEGTTSWGNGPLD